MVDSVVKGQLVTRRWDYRALPTEDTAKVVQSLSAINHYIFLVLSDAEANFEDIKEIRSALAAELQIDTSAVYNRFASARDYIQAGKMYRHYKHGVPISFEDFKQKHFADCSLAFGVVHSITDHRNKVYLDINAFLDKGLSVKEAIMHVAESRNLDRSSVREALVSAVDYYVGLRNDTRYAKYHKERPVSNAAPAQANIKAEAILDAEIKPEVKDTVKNSFTHAPSAPLDPVINHSSLSGVNKLNAIGSKARMEKIQQDAKAEKAESKATSTLTSDSIPAVAPKLKPAPAPKDNRVADVMLGIIEERDHYKGAFESLEKAHRTLSAEMDHIKGILIKAGYGHLI